MFCLSHSENRVFTNSLRQQTTAVYGKIARLDGGGAVRVRRLRLLAGGLEVRILVLLRTGRCRVIIWSGALLVPALTLARTLQLRRVEAATVSAGAGCRGQRVLVVVEIRRRGDVSRWNRTGTDPARCPCGTLLDWLQTRNEALADPGSARLLLVSWE